MQLRLPTYDDVVGSLHGFLMYMWQRGHGVLSMANKSHGKCFWTV
jgi:hypothetical protein